MDSELFRKTERKLYDYYLDKNRLESVRKEIRTAVNLIATIDNNIRTCNISIDPYQGGKETGERVQSSSSCSSYVEKAIIKAIDDMEKEKADRTKELYELQSEERKLISRMDKLEYNISLLNYECKRFLDLKYNKYNQYNKCLGMREIALELNMCKNKAYDFRESLVKNIAEFRLYKN